MTTSHWMRYPSFSSADIKTDILIIGSGYVGLSTAYWLSELHPDLKITVIDRALCGSGASGRNAGFLTLGSALFYKNLSEKWGMDRAKSIHSFAKESLNLLHQKILNPFPEIKFEKTSSITLFKTNQSQMFNSEFFDFSWLDKNQLPPALQGRFYGGFETRPEFKINPIQLLMTLKKILISRKIQIIENSAAFEITPLGVKTETCEIKCKKVILALNGYFPQFHSAFKDEIIAKRAQMLAIELDKPLDCPHLYYDPLERVYWRKIQDNVLIIGGKRLLDEEAETGDFEKNSPRIQKALEEYLKDQLELKYRVINRWSGTMGFTQDELPLAGRIEAPIETFMIGGFSGHGMGMGFHAAKDIAELVLGFKTQTFFSRFKKAEFRL